MEHKMKIIITKSKDKWTIKRMDYAYQFTPP